MNLKTNKEHFLMRNLINSIICVLIALSASSQFKTKKFIKRNKKAPTFQYDNSDIYARALYYEDGRLFIGNSDGSLYFYKVSTGKSQLIFNLPDFHEMRDIAVVNDKILGMQSASNGKMLMLDLKGSLKVLKPTFWDSVFLDGMDFLGNRGFLMGDPRNTTFSLFHTNDGGKNWSECVGKVTANKGEAGFAASGTNVQIINDSTYVFISGGLNSRFFKSTNNGNTWTNVELPYYPGESNGAYSMCFMNDSIGAIVGGDYKDPDIRLNVSFYTTDGGETWFNSEHPVRGYRSCVVEKAGIYYTCGRNGIDFSLNGGIDWIPFANGAFFSMTTSENKLIATMKNGTLKFFELIDNK